MERKLIPGFLLLLGICIHASDSLAETSAGYYDRNTSESSQQLRIDTLNRLHSAKLISDALYNRSMRKLTGESVNATALMNRSIQPGSISSESTGGRYVALIIGNNQYKHFESLETAVNDAEAISTVLDQRYRFEVQLLKNTTRHELFGALAHWQKSLTNKDSFLLYYAGHGYLDPVTKRGYWLPVNAEKHNQSNWISTNDVSNALLAIPARQALVIADSCFSGSLAGGVIRPNTDNNTNLARRSRTVITSGGLEPVLDSIDGEHSVFARVLLNRLNRVTGTPKIGALFDQVSQEVARQVNQSPGYHAISSAGHQHGEFIFPVAE